MKNNNYLFVVFAALCLLATSCKDSYLDEEPYSYYSTGHSDDATIDAQIIGLHRTYAELWGWSSNQGFLSCWQIGTDVASAGATQGVENPFYQYADLNAENAGVSWLWRKCYDFINHSNLIIAALGENNKPAVAEAKFFRAYAYNMLVTLWGDVPLVTEPIATPKFDFTRQSTEEVDALIEEDLTYGIANLPEVGQAANESRINKDMARQLAAEAYLRIGMRESSYFGKAEQAATDIISTGKYSLIQARYGKFLEKGVTITGICSVGVINAVLKETPKQSGLSKWNLTVTLPAVPSITRNIAGYGNLLTTNGRAWSMPIRWVVVVTDASG